ncbi:MAG: bifunctional riboflavin kinase/FMN adenylyltransferase [Candidatus Thermofonsia Clade 1 bacterium]|uniref:Riboflavin biosynthesis protein n=1 Tax=Candidatus Thermofonsia Clade 1 bacterium TaxID=2364210 RepID=A0A2M8NYD5_9CHLR|nr:MAG: bifunctional riboflavin kinase/FMN adenylyltransferase [Candidatus Thermofonsia Clade 1 bacterium]
MAQHITQLSAVQLTQLSVVTIGIFDGVHRGHQHLIRQVVESAHREGHLAAVVTFFPHPDVLLRGITGRYYLTTPEQRADLLAELGVDVIVTQHFDETIRHMRAAAFVDLLIAHLRMKSLWLTPDFALGYQREGDFAFLSAQGREKGFSVHSVDLLMDAQHRAIRSSAIRQALTEGDVAAVADLLARPYRVLGEVVHGDHRGRSIGFPTANLAVWTEQLLPAKGVYACYAYLGAERFAALTNIGSRPTFNGTETRVEAHLLDFDRDIYGQTLKLDFIARLRGEQRFSSVEALIAQISADVAQGRQLLAASAS